MCVGSNKCCNLYYYCFNELQTNKDPRFGRILSQASPHNSDIPIFSSVLLHGKSSAPCPSLLDLNSLFRNCQESPMCKAILHGLDVVRILLKLSHHNNPLVSLRAKLFQGATTSVPRILRRLAFMSAYCPILSPTMSIMLQTS